MKRILTAVILIAVVLGLIFFGQLWMIALFAAIVAILAAYEYLHLLNHTGISVPFWWMALSIVIIFAVTLPYAPVEAQLPALSALTLILFVWNGFRLPLKQVLPDTSHGIFGLIYVVYPLTLVPMLWRQEDGPALVVFLMVCVWSGDIAALYIGRRFGRYKLAPTLSPNKTWEGAIASIGGSMLAAGLVIVASDLLAQRGNTMLHISEPLWQTLLLAAIVNMAAQIGDLLESAIKRAAEVKDSGTMLPGHGGILDRIDALLVAAPVLWFALLIKDAAGLGRF